jgi:hypothetical protein
MAGRRVMIIDMSKARIFIRPGQTDLRKGVSGLTAIVQEKMNLSKKDQKAS